MKHYFYNNPAVQRATKAAFETYIEICKQKPSIGQSKITALKSVGQKSSSLWDFGYDKETF